MSGGAILTALFAGLLLIVLFFAVMPAIRKRKRERPGQQWHPLDREVDGDGPPIGSRARRRNDGDGTDDADGGGGD
jgi:hypothetical protein